MLDKEAYERILQVVRDRRYSDGVFGQALKLHFDDFEAMKARHPAMAENQIKIALLNPTAVQSLIDQAEQRFKEQAEAATTGLRRRRALRAGFSAIILGVASNFLFVAISLIIYLAAQDTARSFLENIGVSFNTSNEPERQTQKAEQEP